MTVIVKIRRLGVYRMGKILGIVIVLVLIGGGAYYFMHNTPESGNQNPPPPPANTVTSPPPPPAPAPSPSPSPSTATPPPPGSTTQTKEFNITGRNFAFSQSEIRVKRGDKVKINFQSTQGFHDWVVDEFDARTSRVNDGQKTSVEFTADKQGTFEFYCSVGTHRAMGMKGRLIVE